MMTKTKTIAGQMEEIAKRHDVDLIASTNESGGIFTTPDWTDWSDELEAEVREIANLKHGPHADYWVAK